MWGYLMQDVRTRAGFIFASQLVYVSYLVRVDQLCLCLHVSGSFLRALHYVTSVFYQNVPKYAPYNLLHRVNDNLVHLGELINN